MASASKSGGNISSQICVSKRIALLDWLNASCAKTGLEHVPELDWLRETDHLYHIICQLTNENESPQRAEKSDSFTAVVLPWLSATYGEEFLAAAGLTSRRFVGKPPGTEMLMAVVVALLFNHVLSEAAHGNSTPFVKRQGEICSALGTIDQAELGAVMQFLQYEDGVFPTETDWGIFLNRSEGPPEAQHSSAKNVSLRTSTVTTPKKASSTEETPILSRRSLKPQKLVAQSAYKPKSPNVPSPVNDRYVSTGSIDAVTPGTTPLGEIVKSPGVRLTCTIRRKDQEIRHLRREIEDALDGLKQTREAHTEAVTKLHDAEKECVKLRDRLKAADAQGSELNAAKKSLQDSTAKTAELQYQLEKTEHELEKVQLSLLDSKRVENERDELTKKKRSLENQLSEIQKQLHAAETKVQKMQHESTVALSEQIEKCEKLNQEKKRLQDELDERTCNEAEFDAAKRQVEQLRKVVSDMEEKLSETKTQYGAKVDGLLEEISRKEEIIVSLRAQLTEGKANVVQLQSELARMIDEYTNFQATVSNERATTGSKIGALEDQLSYSVSQCNELHLDVTDLASQCQSRDVEIEKLRQDLASANDQVLNLETELATVTVEYEECASDYDALKADTSVQISDLNAQIDELQQIDLENGEKMNALEAEVDQKSNDNKKKDAQITELQQHLENSLENVGRLEAQNALLTDAKTKCRVDFEANMTAAQKDLIEAQKLINDLKAKLAESENARKNTTAQNVGANRLDNGADSLLISELQAKVLSLSQKNNEFVNKNVQFSNVAIEANGERVTMQKQVVDMSKEMAALQAERDHLKKRVQELEKSRNDENYPDFRTVKRARFASGTSGRSVETLGGGSTVKNNVLAMFGDDEDTVMQYTSVARGDADVKEDVIAADVVGSGDVGMGAGSRCGSSHSQNDDHVFKKPDPVVTRLNFDEFVVVPDAASAGQIFGHGPSAPSTPNENWDNRLSEINFRNLKLPIHLRSSYPVETQGLPVDVKDEDLKYANGYEAPEAVKDLQKKKKENKIVNIMKNSPVRKFFSGKKNSSGKASPAPSQCSTSSGGAASSNAGPSVAFEISSDVPVNAQARDRFESKRRSVIMKKPFINMMSKRK